MSRSPNWLVPAALGVSLIVNLGLGGYVAGQHLRPEPPKQERPHGPRGHERPEGMPDVSREERREVRQLMRRGFEAAGAELEARRAAERQLAAVLTAEPFDRTAAEAALHELRDADTRMRDRIGLEVIAGLDELSPDQRAWVAYILSGRKDHDRSKHRKHRPDTAPPAKPQD